MVRPDEIMAALLIDLGDCYKGQLSFEHAKALYQVASNYYKSKNTLLSGRIEECRKLREQNTDVHPKGAIEYVQHGVVEKVQGVLYTNLLSTNDNSKSPINWSIVETNPEKFIDISRIKHKYKKKRLKHQKYLIQKIFQKERVILRNLYSQPGMFLLA